MNHHEKRILLVDDHTLMLRGVTMILSEAGYLNIDTDEGPNAIAMLKRNHYDLLIQDVLRPKMGGVGLYRYMKTHPPLSNIPILFLTFSIALNADVLKQTVIEGHSFDGTFRVELGEARHPIAVRHLPAEPGTVLYIEGYLSKERADTDLEVLVEDILHKWASFNDVEKEFRLRDQILWPAAMRALAN